MSAMSQKIKQTDTNFSSRRRDSSAAGKNTLVAGLLCSKILDVKDSHKSHIMETWGPYSWYVHLHVHYFHRAFSFLPKNRSNNPC